ncbi:Lactocepin [Lentibacillus sp. JNUCC-1]|uniref:prenyltransferase/squalene oxidase repeat-containing protein n=1 Tax=Lentibacillus sp. JNUCC-1 TaxID=2654513 RepID=UPI0012E990C9|nr:LPXTG cell wall anchor domain-containing protein [Lentibacillus sp. JNUCC-1]MUV37572.1 Lactocepin [Lentibacillus sp. JNUCC-1]
MRFKSKLLYTLLAFLMVMFTVLPGLNTAQASGGKDYRDEVNAAIDAAVQHILDSGVNSEWEAIGLATAGKDVPASYEERMHQHIKDQIVRGLDNGRIKITDIERIAMAAAAIGKEPRQIESLNLIELIYNSPNRRGDFDTMTFQGNNGPAFALIALDTKKYDVPEDARWTRQKLVNQLLSTQNDDGSWNLNEAFDSPSIDITAMVIIAMSPYKDQPKVKTALNKAVTWLSGVQKEEAGFDGGDFVGGITSEAASQVVIGLTAFGINPAGDKFTKNGHDVISHLLKYQHEDGGFKHTMGDSASNAMATEQALQALVAYKKFLNNEGPLYHFGTSAPINPPEEKPDPKPEKPDNQVDKGNTHQVPDSKTSVQMPDDLPDGTTLDVQPYEKAVNDTVLKQAGEAFTFTFKYPDGENPEDKFELVMGLDQSVEHPEKAAIYYLDEESGEWIYQGGKVDAGKGTVTVDVDHFSTYGVFVDEKAPSDLVLKATDITTDKVTLEFSATDASGIKQYAIYRDGELLGEVTEGRFTDKEVQAETTYEYKLKATDNLNNTAETSTTVTTPETTEDKKTPEDQEKPNKEEETQGPDKRDDDQDKGVPSADQKDGNQTNTGSNVKNNDQSEKTGQSLPKTASNMFNILTAGMALLIIGGATGAVYVYRKKKALN